MTETGNQQPRGPTFPEGKNHEGQRQNGNGRQPLRKDLRPDVHDEWPCDNPAVGNDFHVARRHPVVRVLVIAGGKGAVPNDQLAVFEPGNLLPAENHARGTRRYICGLPLSGRKGIGDLVGVEAAVAVGEHRGFGLSGSTGRRRESVEGGTLQIDVDLRSGNGGGIAFNPRFPQKFHGLPVKTVDNRIPCRKGYGALGRLHGCAIPGNRNPSGSRRLSGSIRRRRQPGQAGIDEHAQHSGNHYGTPRNTHKTTPRNGWPRLSFIGISEKFQYIILLLQYR